MALAVLIFSEGFGHNVNVSLVGLLLSQAESTITKEVPKLKVSFFSLSKMSACKNQSQF